MNLFRQIEKTQQQRVDPLVQKAALVIGGGIAGMQASIDLANMGIQV